MAKRPKKAQAAGPAVGRPGELPVTRSRSHLHDVADTGVLIVAGSQQVELAFVRHTSNLTKQTVNVLDDGQNAVPVGIEVSPLVEEVARIRMIPSAAIDLAMTIIQNLVSVQLLDTNDAMRRFTSAVGKADAAAD